MKKLFSICAGMMTCMSLFAQVPYTIKGTWAEGAGQKVFIFDYDENKTRLPLDSATVNADGSFLLAGSIDKMRPVNFGYGSSSDRLFVAGQEFSVNIVNKETTNRNGEAMTVQDAAIDGGAEHTIFTQLNSIFMSKTITKLALMLAASENKDNPERLDSIAGAFSKMNEELDNGLRAKLDSANNLHAVPYFVNEALLSDYSLDELTSLYDNFTPEVKAGTPGQELKASIDRLGSVNIGGKAPDFTLPTPDGGKISLSDLRGKVVLLDFWATWCGPCLREMPNVKALYEKYHSKGLEILGVSLDKEGDGEKWQQMIKDRGFNWNHGSSLKGWDCPVARTYNVTAIPRMYIINKDGVIIAQDLRGEALAAKMAEIFE